MSKYAYLNVKPAEIVFSNKDVYVKYSGGEDLYIGDVLYKVSSLPELITVLQDIIKIAEME